MSGVRLEQYEAGALSAWTPASQAALNAERHDKQDLVDPAFEAYRDQEFQARKPVKDALYKAQVERDPKAEATAKAELLALDEIWGPEIERFVKDQREEDELKYKYGKPVGGWDDQVTAEGRLKGADKKKMEAREGKYEAAEAISAGEVVDNLIQSWNPPIYDFLNVWGPPHIVIIPYLGAHVYFWFKAPWYLRFLIYQPTIYYIPLWSALRNLKNKNVRLLWIVYFMNLAIIEYIELLFYRDRASSSIMFPKLKAMFCLLSYTVVEPSDDPLYGAIKLVNIIFPRPGDSEKLTPKTRKEKREAARAAVKARADRKLKEAEASEEKERVERKARRAKQAEYIVARS